MGSLMPVTMREKYEKMVKERFTPLITDAMILHQDERDELKHKLKTKRGIYKLEAEIAATEVRLRELKSMLSDRAGHGDSVVLSEANRLLEKKGGIYSLLIAEQKKAVEAIWLAGAPDAVGDILKEIQKALPNLQKQLKTIESKKLLASKRNK